MFLKGFLKVFTDVRTVAFTYVKKYVTIGAYVSKPQGMKILFGETIIYRRKG